MPKITRTIKNDNLQYSKLWKCRNITQLAELLETTEEFLQEFSYDDFNHHMLQKYYNIYTTKKNEDAVRYIEEPVVYRYYLQDCASREGVIKTGAVKKYYKGNYKQMQINDVEHGQFFKQAEQKIHARKLGKRGVFLNKKSYVDVGLKEVQRVLCDILTSTILSFKDCKIWQYQYPEYLHSGVKRRSAKTQMQYLEEQRDIHWDLYDIEKFYQNVLHTHIKAFFKKTMQCNNCVAKVLTNIATFDGNFYMQHKKLEGKELKAMLPTKHIMTGSPLSQKLAFLCFKDLFDDIHNICIQNNGKFALYVDDLTVTNINRDAKKEIISLINKYGLNIKKDKIKHLPADVDKENLGIRLVRNKEHLVPSKKIATKIIQKQTSLKQSNGINLIKKSSKELYEIKKQATATGDKKLMNTINVAQSVKGLNCYKKYIAR